MSEPTLANRWQYIKTLGSGGQGVSSFIREYARTCIGGTEGALENMDIDSEFKALIGNFIDEL